MVKLNTVIIEGTIKCPVHHEEGFGFEKPTTFFHLVYKGKDGNDVSALCCAFGDMWKIVKKKEGCECCVIGHIGNWKSDTAVVVERLGLQGA